MAIAEDEGKENLSILLATICAKLTNGAESVSIVVTFPHVHTPASTS